MSGSRLAVYLRRAGRRNRHAIYFSEEGVRRGDIIGFSTLPVVLAVILSTAWVWSENRQRIASEDAGHRWRCQHETLFAAGATSRGRRLGLSVTTGC